VTASRFASVFFILLFRTIRCMGGGGGRWVGRGAFEQRCLTGALLQPCLVLAIFVCQEFSRLCSWDGALSNSTNAMLAEGLIFQGLAAAVPGLGASKVPLICFSLLK
jgi:hypothetical protein